MRTKYIITKNINLLIKSILIGSIFLISSCNSASQETMKDSSTSPNNNDNIITISKQQFEASKMELSTTEKKKFSATISVNGQLDVPPEFRAAVSAYYGGYVKDISILPGQYIKKGATLFTLENPLFLQMQQEYLQNKGELSYLKNDYERQESLLADKVSSEKEYLKAKATYESVAANTASLAKQLSLININAQQLTIQNLRSVIAVKAPISGYIHRVNAEKGMYLKPESTAVTVINTNHIHIELNIYEKDYNKLAIGQAIQFNLQNNPDKNYSAKIYLISRAMENDKRIIRVHGHLLNEKDSEAFIPGMYVEANILSEASQVAALPESAIINLEESYYVLTLQEENDSTFNFMRHEVKIGATQNGYTEILEAGKFKPNTKFLSKGAFNMINE